MAGQLSLSYVLEREMIVSGADWELQSRNPDVFRVGRLTVERTNDYLIKVSHNGTQNEYAGESRMDFQRFYLHLTVLAKKLPKVDAVDQLRAIEPFTMMEACDALGMSKRHTLFAFNKLINQGKIMEYPITEGPKKWVTTGEKITSPPVQQDKEIDLSSIDTVERLEWLIEITI